MTTSLRGAAVDVSFAEGRRVARPCTATEFMFSNRAGPATPSDTAALQPQEAHHRLAVMWAEAALRHASMRSIDDPAGVIGTVAGLQGVWAHGSDAQEAREELFEVLIDWVALKLEHGDDDIPTIGGVSLSTRP